MNRGDIYWVDLYLCVIVSASPINRARRTVVVVPLSTAATPREPIVVSVDCMGKQVVAVCDQIRTVDKSRLIKSSGSLSISDMNTIDDSLRQILSL